MKLFLMERASFRTAVVLVCMCWLPTAAVAGKSFNLDGFKDIKFGMSTSDLLAMGFKCVDDYHSCEPKDSDSNKRTLFGKPTRIGAKYSEKSIETVNVTIDITDDAMIEQFTSALGKPGTHDYVSFTGYKVRQYYWVSENGTSIVVTKNLDSRTTKNIFGKIVPVNFSTAEYQDRAATKKFIHEAQKGVLDKNDF